MAKKEMLEYGIGGNTVNPYREEVDELVDLINNSKITLIEVFEYTMNIEDNNGVIDHSVTIHTGHKRIVFHIQQRSRK